MPICNCSQAVYSLRWPSLTKGMRQEPKQCFCVGVFGQTQSAWFILQTNDRWDAASICWFFNLILEVEWKSVNKTFFKIKLIIENQIKQPKFHIPKSNFNAVLKWISICKSKSGTKYSYRVCKIVYCTVIIVSECLLRKLRKVLAALEVKVLKKFTFYLQICDSTKTFQRK